MPDSSPPPDPTPAELAALRQEYNLAGLRQEKVAPDPFRQFDQWFAEARAAGVIEPNALTLATTDADGAPSARTVLLKGADSRGFVVFTNYDSTKGRELDANPRAALVFPWLALERQVIVRGAVSRVAREETEAYFNTRPHGSQLGAWASAQSSVVPDRETLENQLKEVTTRFTGQTVPAPPHWGGFRITPHSVEFWQGRRNRLHDRLRYRREQDSWLIERLSP